MFEHSARAKLTMSSSVHAPFTSCLDMVERPESDPDRWGTP